VIIAAELLKRAFDLTRKKIHATSIIAGYRLAMRESIKFIRDNLTIKVDNLGKEVLLNVAKTSMSSKLLGSESNFFAEMVVSAMMNVKSVNSLGETKYPVKNVHILKVHGKSSKESLLVNGYALMAGRSA
jgi:T-complex protein 1 subunit alpha